MQEFRTIEWISSLVNRKSLVVFLCLIGRARSYTLGYRGGGGIRDYHLVFN